MDDKKEILKGIKACFYSIDGVKKYIVKPGTSFFLQVDHTHRFYLEDSSAELFGEQTKNSKSTAATAKWVYIIASFWKEVQKIKGDEVFPFWGNTGEPAKGKAVKYMGIGNQYKEGSFMEFKPSAGNFWIGSTYRMEVFNNVPDSGLYFIFVPVSKPHIRFAYFDKQDFTPTTDKLGINDGIYHYGQTVLLHMSTHLFLVKYAADYHIETEDNIANLELEVILTDETHNPLIEEPIIKDKLSKFIKTKSVSNLYFDIPIYLDPKWKNKIHFKKEPEKSYSVNIRIKNKETKKEYTYQVNIASIQKINEVSRKVELIDVSYLLTVKYESAETILKNFEIRKNNQIQYIGDVEYKHKEYDPCGYAKITIQEEGSSSRKPFDTFDEDAAVIDRTTSSFDIIAGDKKKKVLIKLDKLKNKGVMCTGVLLEKGQQHSDIHNVFQMQKVVMILKNDKGQYVAEEDQTHKKQLKAAGIKVTDENKTDYDYKADPVKRSDGAAVTQNLKEGVDYEYVGDDLRLMPAYNYNKTISEDLIPYRIADDYLNDKLWMFRYFFLGENKAQLYFIPIGSCRYPNQLAKIRVFPDIKWKVSILISDKKVPQSIATTGMPTGVTRASGDTPYHPESKRKDIYQESVDKAKEATKKRKIGGKTFDFDLTLSCVENGTTHEFAKNIAEKVAKFMGFFVTIKEAVDTICHNDEKHAQTVMKKLPKPKGIPLYIKFDYPSIKIDGSWEYAVQPDPEHNAVESSGKITLGFEPLIRGEGGIDLIALALLLAKGVPVVSQVLWALEFIEDGVEFVASLRGYEVSRKLEFNVYAFSQIDARVEVPFNAKDYINMQVDGRLGIGAQLKLEAGIVSKAVLMEADQVPSGFGLSVDAKGESYIELLASAGIEKGTDKGFFVEPKVNFGGVKLTIIIKSLGKADGKNSGGKRLNKPIWVVEKIPDIVKIGRFYPFS